ncbi:MAG TPA: type II secretion system protein [Phycisphaerae bacterium]|nr:type II secretion system protein [Phycisphaerae bacterium]
MRTRYSKPIARGAPPARAGFSLVELPFDKLPSGLSLRVEDRVVRKRKSRAFTLVELLIVISVIVLLVGILTPSLYKARSITYNTRSKAALHELSAGALAYQKDTGYYPGQQYPGILGNGNGQFNGSQVLAACVYGLRLGEMGTSDEGKIGYPTGESSPTSPYVSYKKEKVLLDESPSTYFTAFVPSDLFPDPLPILYYPSRLGNNGSLGDALNSGTFPGAFRYNDNAGLTGPAVNNSPDTMIFRKTIWDTRFGCSSNNPDDPNAYPKINDLRDRAYKSDSFLLIGAGIDRKIFTGDDVKNFKQ